MQAGKFWSIKRGFYKITNFLTFLELCSLLSESKSANFKHLRKGSERSRPVMGVGRLCLSSAGFAEPRFR